MNKIMKVIGVSITNKEGQLKSLPELLKEISELDVNSKMLETTEECKKECLKMFTTKELIKELRSRGINVNKKYR